MMADAVMNQHPDDLPVPEDDGAADHLARSRLPSLTLQATSGEIDLAGLDGTVVIYCYPMTATPGQALPADWDQIPGARGCTPQSCAFRDHATELRDAGVDRVIGISMQSLEELTEAKDRLGLPYDLASASDGRLARALDLPTFEADGQTCLKRLTIVARDGVIAKVFYPVFPPDRNATDVLGWLKSGQRLT